MKIKKIYIKNFKGIRDKKIINLSNQTSLLIGPNGFGKTTIYDVLELCLTGKMNRTIQKSAVTKDTSDYKKPFYQNTISEEVVVKVWLEKENDYLIITKFLPKDSDGRIDGKGRKNKPCDFELLRTYRDSPADFENEEFIPRNENLITQEDIDSFFDFQGFRINEVYNLFNYLQQEETTFFLKKSEKDRKDTLGFLFHTSDEEDKLGKITLRCKKLKEISNELQIKIDNAEKFQKEYGVEYYKIFDKEEIKLDQRNLFQNFDLDECQKLKEEYYMELDTLSTFLNTFSSSENEKKRKLNILNDIMQNKNIISYYILQIILEKSSYETLLVERELLNDDSKLKAFILRNCILKYSEYLLNSEKYSKYELFLEIKDFNTQIEKIKEFVIKLKPERLDDYLSLVEQRKQLVDSSKEIDLSISEIIRLRNSINEELVKNKNNSLANGTCPFCGNKWNSFERLKIEFDEREKSLRKILTNQNDRLSSFDSQIVDEFIVPITDYMNLYLEQNEKIDVTIMEHLDLNQGIQYDFSDIENIKFTERLIWSKPKRNEDLKKSVDDLKKIITNKMQVSLGVFERLKEFQSISFESEIKQLEQLVSMDGLREFIIKNDGEKVSEKDVEEKLKSIMSFLEKEKEKYKYDHEKTNDKNNYYEKYFNSNADEFKRFELSKLTDKKKYIEYAFIQKQTSLLHIYYGRKQKLDIIIKNYEKLKEIYSETIRNYKKDMADKIKIPFYIYTAKILQNYQQGMGVFLSTKENSDSIRFLTDSSSDHDAMHQLSSGQLAVISLAFALAINKTYNISKNLKFLTIDDPIQEMDALNIHSFIELIRHEFLGEYQLIFSTHNDINALYMKYKFEKINPHPVSMINVQTEFFDV